jgi:hypothetical protein
MKKAILLCGMLLAASATLASAAGLNLFWDNCAGDAGIQNKTFACNTNVGSRGFVGSFVVDADIPVVNGNELVVDLQSASAVLPDWWQFVSAGVCRNTGLSIAAHNGANCPDMFEGQASMNIAAYQLAKHGLANEARILCVNAVQASAVVVLFTGQEYGIARWTITNGKTVGSPSCTGCTVPVCIVFNSANITTEQAGVNVRLTNEAAPGSAFCTWQGGAGTNCPGATPTKNSSWGAVKSLYR